MSGKLTKQELDEAIQESGTYNLWKLKLESGDIHLLELSSRMDFVLTGIHIGITLDTALPLCSVTIEEYNDWAKNLENAEKLRRANAFMEAQLETIVYAAAKRSPVLAVSILEKRNPKRWMPTDTSPIVPDNTRGGHVRMSDALDAKRKNYINGDLAKIKDFDVE
jgi:hypothetical protein